MDLIDRNRLDRAFTEIDTATVTAIEASKGYRRARDQIKNDTLLSDEGRKAAINEERRRAEAEVARQQAVATSARRTIEQIAQREMDATRAPDAALVADARARVRSLLDRGTELVKVRDQAVAQRDRLTLAALRHEAAYVAQPGDEVLASLEEAERLLLTGDERVAADALALLRRKWVDAENDLLNAGQLDTGGGMSGLLARKMGVVRHLA